MIRRASPVATCMQRMPGPVQKSSSRDLYAQGCIFTRSIRHRVPVADHRHTAWYRCSTTLNSLNTKRERQASPGTTRQASGGTASWLKRSRTVKHQPGPYRSGVGRVGLEPTTDGL